MVSKDISLLQKKLGVSFKDENLLRQSLIHRSYLNENPGEELEHNERLEFLGDAVLELIVTEYLYRNHPNPEGDLTSWRAALVNSQMMAEVANDLRINDFLFLSKGESKDTGRARQAILANTLEAIIGAVYLDSGYQKAKEFVEEHIMARLKRVLEQKLYRDAKSFFQESAQEKVGFTPIYRVLSESGPDHARYFRMGVYLKEELIAEGAGNSKQEAEQQAAKNALKIKKWL